MGIEYKISGVIQLAAVLIIVIYIFLHAVPRIYALSVAMLFIIKGISFTIFKQNPLSLLDTVAGLYLFFPVLGWFSNTVLNIIVIIFLAQKGITYLFR
jgi:hypothetical protein